MTKEKLIEELTTKATGTARMEKKSRQFLQIVFPALVLFLICYALACFDVLSMKILAGALIGFMVVMFACGIFLPFGKISEEKINKYFQEKLSSRLKDVQSDLDNINNRKPKLEEELKLLKEI